MAVDIPVDAHLVTILVTSYEFVNREIQVGRQRRTQRERVERVERITPNVTEQQVRSWFVAANNVWTPVGMTFYLRSIDSPESVLPNNSDTVDTDGFVYLAGRYPARGRTSSAGAQTGGTGSGDSSPGAGNPANAGAPPDPKGVTLLFVRNFRNPMHAGRSIEAMSAAILPALGDKLAGPAGVSRSNW